MQPGFSLASKVPRTEQTHELHVNLQEIPPLLSGEGQHNGQHNE